MNRENFFALYWGQDVAIEYNRRPTWTYRVLNNLGKINYLKLKPLSSITEEDILEGLFFVHGRLTEVERFPTYISLYDEQHDATILFDLRTGVVMQPDMTYYMDAPMTDYLRSKGYAVPYMGHSVEELIKNNLIRIA